MDGVKLKPGKALVHGNMYIFLKIKQSSVLMELVEEINMA